MFCPLERIELKTDNCPVSRCIYKNASCRCAYEELTKDDVSPSDIAAIRGLKPYKVKFEAAPAKEMVARGMVILRYAEYIKATYPNLGSTVSIIGQKTVNEDEGHVTKVLSILFGLSKYQQDKFWKQQKYDEWKSRYNVSYTLNDLLKAIAAAQL